MVRYKHPKPTGAINPDTLLKEGSAEPALEKETFSQEPPTKGDTPIWKELRILVATKLYGAERLSLKRAAKLAGINPVKFPLDLGFYKVFPLSAELNALKNQHE